MNGYTREIGSWEELYLDEEPIYCAAPSPSTPDDILCAGSDDATDKADRIAKIRRYEKYGRRYLQGRPLHILSASLHGPFDKASGWKNPWLPKTSSQRVQDLEGLHQPPTVPSAIPNESDGPVSIRANEGGGAIQEVGDSMECHLPSPQSHEDLQFSESPSHFERHARIVSWADDVQKDSFEEHQFWAPNRSSIDRDAEPSTKRPADRDWLKRRPAKKRRPDTFQSTESTHTPTPMPTARPRSKNTKGSIIGRSVHRNFKMTTPSSSPDKGHREPLSTVNGQPVVSCEKDGQPILPALYTRGSQVPSESPVQGAQEEEGEGEENKENECHDEDMKETGLPEETHTGLSRPPTPHGGDRFSEATDFEDRVDESFYYRVRQSSRDIPLETSIEMGDDCGLQHTQAETSISQEADGTDIVPPQLQAQEHDSNGEKTEDATIESDNISTTGSETTALVATAPESDLRLSQPREVMSPGCDTTEMGTETNYTPEANKGQVLSDITSNEHASRFNIRNAASWIMSNVKKVQSTSSEPSLDDDHTLIGEPIDIENLDQIETSQRKSSVYSFDNSTVLQHYTRSTGSDTGANQLSQYDETTTLDNLNATIRHITPMVDQEEAAEPRPSLGEPMSPGSPKETSDADTVTGKDGDDSPQIIARDQSIPVEQQSPWANTCGVDETTQPENDDTEPVKENPGVVQPKTITTLLDSPATADCSPIIRPSQQSPWIRVVTEPTSTIKLEEATSIKNPVSADIELAEERQTSLVPTNEERLPLVASSPVILSISREPSPLPVDHQSTEEPSVVIEGNVLPSIQDVPYTPVHKIVRQSTPDGEVSIRSFSNFNFASPQRSVCPPTSATRSILSSRKYQGTRPSTNSSRRVSFAPLPHEQEDNSSQSQTRSRAASPPPSAIVDLEEENVNGKYRNHFELMNRRINVHGVSNLRHRLRLLPSSSQRKPESPSFEAMAEAFRGADLDQLDCENDMVENAKADDINAEDAATREIAEEPGTKDSIEKPQSPWQQDSQGVDDVAAVMGNLDDFLDVWDVDTEINKNREGLDETERYELPSDPDMRILRGVGIW